MPITTLDPNTALVLIDLQQGIAAMPLAHPFPEVLARACTLLDAWRQRGLPVMLVRVTGAPPGRTDRGPRSGTRPADFAELVPALQQQASDHVVTKQTPGAFTHTGLESHLKNLGVTQIVLAGVATSNGIEATAREAYALGFNVSFAIDAMTDGDLATHSHSIAHIFPKLGESGLCASIIDCLNEETKA